MRKFKQQYYECALASMCMATGKDYPWQSRKFHRKHGYMFGDAGNAGKHEWLSAAENYLQAMNQGVKPKWFRGALIDFLPLKNQRHVPLSGQGVMSVIKGCYRHTMAFCDGKIYDPAESYIVTWSQWRRRNPRWKVYNVTRMDLPTVAK